MIRPEMGKEPPYAASACVDPTHPPTLQYFKMLTTFCCPSQRDHVRQFCHIPRPSALLTPLQPSICLSLRQPLKDTRGLFKLNKYFVNHFFLGRQDMGAAGALRGPGLGPGLRLLSSNLYTVCTHSGFDGKPSARETENQCGVEGRVFN